MNIRIALAGNPNSGKTTLFNALTGSNQFVGNWPGVTVEKKEGKLKNHDSVTIVDLPGIYSLSPYSQEEVIAREYLVKEKPEAILNIIDGTNLERNLYLTTQLMEMGIPMVLAINMSDVVRKNGDKIDTKELSKRLGYPVFEISALKKEKVTEAAEAAILAASSSSSLPYPKFSEEIEKSLSAISSVIKGKTEEKNERWYTVKVLERDSRINEELSLTSEEKDKVEFIISTLEKEEDDEGESIITNERYSYIAKLIEVCYRKKSSGLSTTDKIDKVVTDRWLALPIFALVMWLVYYVSVTTIGTFCTDFVNDGIFGDGFYFLGKGRVAYEEAAEEFTSATDVLTAFGDEKGIEWEELDEDTVSLIASSVSREEKATYTLVDEETLGEEEVTVDYAALMEAVDTYEALGYAEPDTSDYGPWVPSIPALISSALEAIGCADWLQGLIIDGIVAGVGAVLGFVPQMLVLFLFLAFLESCGYMARIAFVMDRIFRKFGLSGKSFIPILIGTGCGVPGIMASRTIENEKDRRMTIITTTFIPCGAKLPFIAMIAGAVFGGASWVAPTAYFLGMAAIITSGIILKKTKLFSGDPSPFVMELPDYHWPTVSNVLRSMWERGWSFIKKAGTIILLSTVVIWFTTFFGFTEEGFRMLGEDEIGLSILAQIGSLIAWIFYPLGWGTWQATVASIIGLVAKENIVGTLGIIYGATGSAYAGIAEAFTSVTGFSFLTFNLLCAPCFAAIGAIKREMNSGKWTWIAIGYQCIFAYLTALVFTQVGNLICGFGINIFFLIVAVAVIALFIYLLFRRERKVAL
ncbi:MAG: ferrous iron transporter B [Candidatus Ornithospirochaeta sp.]|nr:ferrous iron transporter B [Sphaerochaetaceae bacterium]MDY5524409.1 ferrous iron transporter B [Candidatus Ornithospirochaeta sp.]